MITKSSSLEPNEAVKGNGHLSERSHRKAESADGREYMDD